MLNNDYVLNAGPTPSTPKGTRNIIQVSDKRELTHDKTKWDIRIHHQDGNTVTVQVRWEKYWINIILCILGH